MSTEEEFDRFLAGLRSASCEAVVRLVNEYGTVLLREAVGRLRCRRDPGYGPEDVLQSVYRSFFARVAKGQFDIRTSANLVGILVVMTRRKCASRLRAEMAAKRGRPRLLSIGAGEDGAPAADLFAAPADPAADAAVLIDLTERLARDLPTPTHRRVAELLLGGCDAGEIGTRVNRSARTVRRIVGDITRHLERILDLPGAVGAEARPNAPTPPDDPPP